MPARHKTIQICRVYEPPKNKKGLWILIDRLWPRGLKKEALDFDLWLKDIAPDTSLRRWFHVNPEKRWEEFANKYKDELQEKGALLDQIMEMAEKKPLTLFYAAKDPKYNHARILQSVLLSWP